MSFTLFGQGSLPAASGSAALAGTQFQISNASIVVNRIWFYSYSSATALPNHTYIYTFGGGKILREPTTVWSGAAGSGWVSCTLMSPLILAVGNYFVTAGFASVQPVVEFPSTAPSNGPLSSTECGYSLTVGAKYPDNLIVSTYLGVDIEVSYLPLVIGVTDLPKGVINTPYSQTLTSAGGSGTYTWSILSGSLPAGLTLDPSGVISGTPALGGNEAQISRFTVQVTDSAGETGTQAYVLYLVSTGSWWSLLETEYAAAALRRDELSNPPLACPNDGTPLVPSPPNSSSRLFCPFDGWKYPQDDYRPAV